MKRFATNMFLALLAFHACFASDFTDLRASQGQTLPQDFALEAYVISDCKSLNTALNPNTAWNVVDLSLSYRTVYVESVDGRYGLRLTLSDMYCNNLERGDLVRVDLSGIRPLCSEGAWSVEDVDISRFEILSRGNNLPTRKKKISELTDEDIYTLVEVLDLEFLSKQGSLVNIFEQCAQRTSENRLDPAWRTADGWASLLEDKEGNHIYMQLNSMCTGRRNVLDFPKGIGSIEGIVVNESNRRYGRSFGHYSIRPVFLEDIHIPLEEQTTFETVVSWRWDHNRYEGLTFKKAGRVNWIVAPGIENDSIVAEKGTGLLYTDSGAAMRVDDEYDARHCSDRSGRASRAAGALRLDSRTGDWIGGRDSEYKSIIVKTTTAKVKGHNLLFNFSFVAGNQSLRLSYGYPLHWKVEWSTDGSTWTDTGFRTSLRPIAFNRSAIDHVFYGTFYDCAMGFPEFSIPLPPELIGQENVYIKIVPSDAVVAALCKEPAQSQETGGIYNANAKFALRIGMVELKAY